MAKENQFEEEARKAILTGMATVAAIVGATLGPRGKTVILGRPMGPALITKDGVTVARYISLPDPFENEGAKLIQEVAGKTNAEAGDGTTAATILCHAIFSEGNKIIAAGHNAMSVERGIQRAVGCVREELKKMAQPVDPKDITQIRHVAMIAANSDPVLGDVIARAVHRVGVEGVVMVDTSPTIDTDVEFSEGLQFDRGFLAPQFMLDRAKGVTVFENCNIFVTDRRLIDGELMGKFLLNYFVQCGQAPLLIIAEDVAEGALQVLVVNNQKRVQIAGRELFCQVCPVKAPGSGPTKKEELEDIAIFSGARAFVIAQGDDITTAGKDDFGSAAKVVITPTRTTIVNGEGSVLRLDTRKDEIRTRIAEPATKEFERAQLERRLALLSASIAVIKIGSAVHSKLLEKRDRVEDSVSATKAALKEGIVPGGGMALMRAIPALRAAIPKMAHEEQIGAQVILSVLDRPLHRLASNSGVSGDLIVGRVLQLVDGVGPYEDAADFTSSLAEWGYNAATDRIENLVEAGVIDPVKVVRLALENSAELAGLLLTSAAMVVDIPEPTTTGPAPR
jgi:chaperonin GroEL